MKIKHANLALFVLACGAAGSVYGMDNRHEPRTQYPIIIRVDLRTIQALEIARTQEALRRVQYLHTLSMLQALEESSVQSPNQALTRLMPNRKSNSREICYE